MAQNMSKQLFRWQHRHATQHGVFRGVRHRDRVYTRTQSMMMVITRLKM